MSSTIPRITVREDRPEVPSRLAFETEAQVEDQAPDSAVRLLAKPFGDEEPLVEARPTVPYYAPGRLARVASK
jgi:hypothetical protein